MIYEGTQLVPTYNTPVVLVSTLHLVVPLFLLSTRDSCLTDKVYLIHEDVALSLGRHTVCTSLGCHEVSGFQDLKHMINLHIVTSILSPTSSLLRSTVFLLPSPAPELSQMVFYLFRCLTEAGLSPGLQTIRFTNMLH